VKERDKLLEQASYIRSGIEEGANLLIGGAEAPEGLDTGFFVRPTVFSEVSPKMAIAQEEIFGPVLTIIPVDSEEEAIEVANDSRYGLSGAVWAKDPDRALAWLAGCAPVRSTSMEGPSMATRHSAATSSRATVVSEAGSVSRSSSKPSPSSASWAGFRVIEQDCSHRFCSLGPWPPSLDRPFEGGQ
jgi:hypothetical protein